MPWVVCNESPGTPSKIRESLAGQEFVDLETLCRELEASESSVRRDLIALESEGVLKRVYGGAMAVEARDHVLDFAWQSARMGEEKQRIARWRRASSKTGQTLILDGGSTVAAVARELSDRPLHVMTNSLPIAESSTIRGRSKLTLTGGYLYPRLRVMVGPLCEQMLAA